MANRLARWVSITFDSSFLSVPLFLAIGWLDSRATGLAWAVMTLIIVTGISLAYILIGKHSQQYLMYSGGQL